MFAVRYSAAHGRGNVFVVRLTLTHGKGDEQPNGVNVWWGKNVCTNKNARLFAVRQIKTHGKLFFTGRFFCRAPWKYARQNSSLPCARNMRTETCGNHRFPGSVGGR
jgi:hypothetical protein